MAGSTVAATHPARRTALTLQHVAMVAQTQALRPRGSFACSDPFLTQLWQACRRNLQLCLQEIHLDSPHHQEPLGDHGDYLIETAAFGPYALIGQDLRRMTEDLCQHQGRTFHSTYALLLPDLVLDHLIATGDRNQARHSGAKGDPQNKLTSRQYKRAWKLLGGCGQLAIRQDATCNLRQHERPWHPIPNTILAADRLLAQPICQILN